MMGGGGSVVGRGGGSVVGRGGGSVVGGGIGEGDVVVVGSVVVGAVVVGVVVVGVVVVRVVVVVVGTEGGVGTVGCVGTVACEPVVRIVVPGARTVGSESESESESEPGSAESVSGGSGAGMNRSTALAFAPVSGGVSHAGRVIVLLSRLTVPFRASTRPSTVVPACRLTEVNARMLPTKLVSAPSVADVPTCQNTLQA